MSPKESDYDKYFNISDSRLDALLKRGLVVFDTSALLDLYFYSPTIIEKLTKELLPFFLRRLVIPNHVYFEYIKNKDKVLNKPKIKYEALLKEIKNEESGHLLSISKSIVSMKRQIENFERVISSEKKHPKLDNIDTNSFSGKIDELEALYKILKSTVDVSVKDKIESIGKFDPISSNVVSLFEVGSEYPFSKTMEIAKDGEFRYKFSIPPGYEDWSSKGNEGKLGLQIFGDLIVWHQILDIAKTKGIDVLLITNDLKEDWWTFENRNRTNAPRFELISEFNDKTKQNFWMLTLDDFIFQSSKIVNSSITDKELKEIESVRKKREQTISFDKSFPLLAELYEAICEYEYNYDIKDEDTYYVESDIDATCINYLETEKSMIEDRFKDSPAQFQVNRMNFALKQIPLLSYHIGYQQVRMKLGYHDEAKELRDCAIKFISSYDYLYDAFDE